MNLSYDLPWDPGGGHLGKVLRTKLLRPTVRKLFLAWMRCPIADWLWMRISSAGLWLVRWKTNGSYTASDSMFSVTEGSRTVRYARRVRAAPVLKSLRARFDAVAHQYALGLVNIQPEGLVLDVGANVGEVSLVCRELGAIVHAFEPDPAEFACLVANSDSSMYPHRLALWNKTGSAPLFLANDTGDSSLLTPVRSEGLTTVETVTLDDWARDHLDRRAVVDLLKLEAEGAEPEILEGAEKLLARVRFISADVGFERPGEDGLDSTLPAVVNFLLARNFSVLWVGMTRMVVLFRNNKLA